MAPVRLSRARAAALDTTIRSPLSPTPTRSRYLPRVQQSCGQKSLPQPTPPSLTKQKMAVGGAASRALRALSPDHGPAFGWRSDIDSSESALGSLYLWKDRCPPAPTRVSRARANLRPHPPLCRAHAPPPSHRQRGSSLHSSRAVPISCSCPVGSSAGAARRPTCLEASAATPHSTPSAGGPRGNLLNALSLLFPLV